MFRGSWLLAAITLLGSAAVAQNRQIIVQVLDGDTGKPIANQHLTIYAGDSPDAVIHRKMNFQAVTNQKGFASLNTPPAAKWLQVWADWKTLCQDNPKGKSFSIDEILSTGLAAPNTCSSLVQKPDPGQFVLFARRSTAKEELRQ
jgi:hypothetical protein